jgi:antitoxin FitA
MTVNLSIKNVPDALAEKLRRRAASNHRSLQGELMALLESSLVALAARQEHAEYVVNNGAVNKAAGPRAEETAVQPTLREVWDQARAERHRDSPSSVELVQEMREERAAEMMKLVSAADSYTRARALLGLTGEQVATFAQATPARQSRRAGRVSRATSRVKHG